MGTISNVEAFADEKRTSAEASIPWPVPQVSPTKLSLLFFAIGYYPNGKRAYINVSAGGIVILLIILLAGIKSWSQIAQLLKLVFGVP
jgi:hypothetical protein